MPGEGPITRSSASAASELTTLDTCVVLHRTAAGQLLRSSWQYITAADGQALPYVRPADATDVEQWMDAVRKAPWPALQACTAVPAMSANPVLDCLLFVTWTSASCHNLWCGPQFFAPALPPHASACQVLPVRLIQRALFNGRSQGQGCNPPGGEKEPAYWHVRGLGQGSNLCFA